MAKISDSPRRKLFRPVQGQMDIIFFLATMLLLVIGLIMLFSASYPNAYYLLGNSLHYISRQMAFAVLGVIAMYVISKADYHIFHRLAYPLLGASLVMLVVVFFMPAINHAHRWIFIGNIINFQPSEIAKFSLVILFAHWMSINPRSVRTLYGLIPYICAVGVFALLLVAEPHLSATFIMGGMAVIMLILGGLNLRWLGGLIAAGAPLGLLVIFVMGKWDRLVGRFMVWWNPEADARGDGWQTLQSLYSIGSGGLMGTGIGKSRQKYLFLPEPQNDFIFAIVCEELGFIGATLILLLFALLIWRGFVIGVRARDRFGSFIALGLTVQLALQVLLNIAVATNSFPNTGIGLPFFSYGGTSLLMLLGQVGVILSVSRQSKPEDE